MRVVFGQPKGEKYHALPPILFRNTEAPFGLNRRSCLLVFGREGGARISGDGFDGTGDLIPHRAVQPVRATGVGGPSLHYRRNWIPNHDEGSRREEAQVKFPPRQNVRCEQDAHT